MVQFGRAAWVTNVRHSSVNADQVTHVSTEPVTPEQIIVLTLLLLGYHLQ